MTCRVPFSTLILILLAAVVLAGCSGQTGKRSAQGAAIGGISGAAAGVVSALIFGGNVGEAAAWGATWGATSGAVSGAIAGSQEDSRARLQAQAEAERQLKKRLGDDAFAGLSALATCKHKVAVGYAETAQESSTEQYVVAGLWLEAVTFLDQGDDERARALYPAIIAADENVAGESDAERLSAKAYQGLLNIRKRHGLPETCSS